MTAIRLYKFCGKLENALKSIQNQNLKVATGADINDPFEILPLSLPDREHRTSVRKRRRAFFDHAGLISFSKTWQNPLMWSHYGHNHKSLCLGFDVDREVVFKVRYVKKMPIGKFQSNTNGASPSIILSDLEQYVATKSADWKYEKEYRVIVPLEGNDPYDGNIIFTPMNGKIRLREVIIGADCTATIEDVEDVLGGLKGVEVCQARLAFHSFKVTKQKDPKRWNRRNVRT